MNTIADDLSLKRIAEIIYSLTGNVVAEKNYSMIEARMRTRLNQLKITSMGDYWEYFDKNRKEEEEKIIGLMTTHHTFFFREFLHFEALKNHILENLDYYKQKKMIKVWSAACSRGHEVYSLAMFLHQEIQEKYDIDFRILGTDIDPASVVYGKNGVYPLKEVLTIPGHYLNPYWKKGTGGVEGFAAVKGELRAKTEFEQLNLFEVENYRPQEKFDFIFVRNVFIYFKEDDVKKIALSLMEKVDERGALVSGVSEALRFSDQSFPSRVPSFYLKTAPHVAPQKENIASTYKVLCVDDSKTIQMLLKKILSADPLCKGVDVALNGLEARDLLQKNQYDVITLDIHMPEMDGMTFLKQVYDRNKHSPVIMISSVNRLDQDLAVQALKLGAYDYVEKPAMNRMKESSDEVLNKVKLALSHSKDKKSDTGVSDFVSNVGLKIKASSPQSCLNIMIAKDGQEREIEDLIKSVKAVEGHAPILVSTLDGSGEIMAKKLKYPNVVISKMSENTQFELDKVYILDSFEANDLVTASFKKYSLMFLSPLVIKIPEREDYKSLFAKKEVQILIDESASSFFDSFLKATAEISPATSFSSLSLEFFANLRSKAAA